jgi:hypothetical protein
MINIDLRDVPTLWINLKEHEKNADEMKQMLDSYGFKDHRRTPGVRVSGLEKVRDNQRADHYTGVGIAQMNAWSQIKGHLPALILEDDVKITHNFRPMISVPDGTDAVYLGFSNAGTACGVDMKNGYARIRQVMSGHAILYLTKRYLQETINVAKHCLFDLAVPFDVGTASIQQQFNVIAPYSPFFAQSDDRLSENKWEHFTKNSIRMFETL